MLKLVPWPLSGPNAGAYLNIEGGGLHLSVIGPPPKHRSSPVTVWLDFAGAVRWRVTAETYEAGAEILLHRVCQLVSDPSRLLEFVAQLEDVPVEHSSNCEWCRDEEPLICETRYTAVLAEFGKMFASTLSARLKKTVYLAKCWYYDDSEVIGVYESELAAIEAVRRRAFSHDGWHEGAVQRAHRRRLWRSRRVASTQRWIGARPWLRYPLKREDFVRRSQGTATWSTKQGVGYGVFPYQVQE